jgi:PAS domain S-box-containing protein
MRSGGAVFHARLDCVFMEAGNGGHSVRIALTDITSLKRAEDVIIKAGEKFHTLIDSISDTVFITDMEGHFIQVNHSACERLGYSQEELLQMGPADIDTPEYAAKVPERIKALHEQGELVFESAHVRKDGVVIPVELSNRIVDYDGKPVIIGVARDITERKRAEEELRIAAAFESQQGMMVTDSAGVILRVNQAFTRLTGYSAVEAVIQVGLVVEKVQEIIATPYMFKGIKFNYTTSIGACLFGGHDESVDDLLRHADLAMYQAK